MWAVVYKFTTIDIPSGVTVTFENHRSGAPVYWLAQGDVFIGGTVELSGQDGATSGPLPTFSKPGPGGFAGGQRGNGTISLGSGGFGPGGGNRSVSSYWSGGNPEHVGDVLVRFVRKIEFPQGDRV